MDSLDKFLDFYIDKITADRSVPIDLSAVSAAIGVVVEEREMIPEAAMQAKGQQFFIYLQSNFVDMPGNALRRRFSLAHELGHTLFYEKRGGDFKPRKDAPRGDSLEAACHKAASRILVPTKAIKAQLRLKPPTNSLVIVELGKQFEVSVEVMIRRLDELNIFEGDWAPVLTRSAGNILAIQYAVYPFWLVPHLADPKRGIAFKRWFQGLEQPDGTFTKDTDSGILEARPMKLAGSSTMFEVRMRP